MLWKDIKELKSENTCEILVETKFFGIGDKKYATAIFLADHQKIVWLAYPGRIRNFEPIRYVKMSDLEKGVIPE